MHIQAPTFENRITIGSLVSVVGLLVTTVGFGIAIGSVRADIDTLKADRVQTVLDSRAIIGLQKDMVYLKEGFAEVREYIKDERK